MLCFSVTNFFDGEFDPLATNNPLQLSEPLLLVIAPNSALIATPLRYRNHHDSSSFLTGSFESPPYKKEDTVQST